MDVEPVILLDQPLFDSLCANQISTLGAFERHTIYIDLFWSRHSQARLICDFSVSKRSTRGYLDVPESLNNLLPPLETRNSVPCTVITLGVEVSG
jgi:hypothetical protein